MLRGGTAYSKHRWSGGQVILAPMVRGEGGTFIPHMDGPRDQLWVGPSTASGVYLHRAQQGVFPPPQEVLFPPLPNLQKLIKRGGGV